MKTIKMLLVMLIVGISLSACSESVGEKMGNDMKSICKDKDVRYIYCFVNLNTIGGGSVYKFKDRYLYLSADGRKWDCVFDLDKVIGYEIVTQIKGETKIPYNYLYIHFVSDESKSNP